MLNNRALKTFPLKEKKKKTLRIPTITTMFNIVLEVLCGAINKEKQDKGKDKICVRWQ